MHSVNPQSSLYYHQGAIYNNSLQPIDIDPKVLSLPKEGMAEYILWADCHNKITKNLLDTVKILNELMDIDPAKADFYSRQIDERLRKANLNMMEWEVTRRRILIKWLRDNVEIRQ